MGNPFQQAILATSGLVAYWRFSEGVGSVAGDSGPHGRDMSAVGVPAPAWAPTLLGGGQTGGATTIVKADNRWWATVSNPSDLNVGDNMTVMAVVKPTATALAAGDHLIVSKGLNAYGMGFRDGLFKVHNFVVIIGSDGAPVAGTRYHVAWSKAGATNLMVLNGADVTPAITNQTLQDNLVQVSVGNDFNTQFDGQIAEVALFNRGLSLAEIQAIYAKIDSAPTGSALPGGIGGSF